MGVENFIPTIWSAKLFVRLRKNLVFAGLVNTDYEGEITEFGDRVRINEIGPVAVKDYVKNKDIEWDELDSAQKELIINRAKYFSFRIDSIDKAQAKPKLMNGAMSESAYGIADAIDQDIAKLYDQAGIINATNLGSSGSPKSVSSGNIIELVTYAGRYMTEHNVPLAGRIMTIPAWFHQKLLLAEVGGIGATAVPKTFDGTTYSAGYVGDALGFTFALSNNVQEAATSVSAIMALTRQAISYAGQVTEIDAVKIERGFGVGVKGLYVYGVKAVRPEALCTIYATEAAG